MSREVLFLLITFFSFSIAAQRPGALYLLIPPSAKATGMAYAYTAICDDASANYYNTAGLAFIESPEITSSYSGYLPGLHPDRHFAYLGFGYPLYSSAWGFDIIFFTEGKIEIWDHTGKLLGESLIWRIVPKINYARRLSDKFSFGIGWKFMYQKYGSYDPWWGWPDYSTGSSWAFDFNCLYKILPNLSVGSVLHNIGPDILYEADLPEGSIPASLPWLFRLGVAYRPVESDYFSSIISAEVTKVLVGMFAQEENSFWENVKYEFKEAWKGIGLEFVFYKIVSVRGGYFYDLEGYRKGFTFGGGINVANFELDIGIDENLFDFDTQNRKISLSYTF